MQIEAKRILRLSASFGCEDLLLGVMPGSLVTFPFPQRNGDVFAFDSDVNRVFQHGVPRGKKVRVEIFDHCVGKETTHQRENGGGMRMQPINDR